MSDLPADSDASPDAEARRLQALRELEILDTAAEPVCDDLCALAAQVSAAPMALLSLVDAGRAWFKSRHGMELQETSRDAWPGATDSAPRPRCPSGELARPGRS